MAFAAAKAVYTRGPIGSTMLKTAFSMLAGTLAMSGYNLADTYFVGQLPGVEPLAAMGFSFPVIMLLGCVFHGLSAGVMTNCAQELGRGDLNKSARIVNSGLLLITLISILLGVAGILSGPAVFQRFGAGGKALEQTIAYMNIWYFGCLTSSLAMTGNNLLVTAGDTKCASGMMVLGMLINVLLDPWFIFGWGPIPAMGIRGAALATIGSQAVSMAGVLLLLAKRHRLVRWEPIPWHVMRAAWWLILRYGVPAMIGMLMMPIASTILTRIIASFGNAAVAAVSAVNRLETVAFIFPMALGISLMPMVGQNYGAQAYSRLRGGFRFAMGFAFCFLVSMAIIFAIFARYVVPKFNADPEVQRIMNQALLIIPWGFWGVEIHRYSGFFFTGCARPKVSAWLNALRVLGFIIPFSLLALWANSVAGIFWARLAADTLSGVIGFLLTRRMIGHLPDQDGIPVPPVRSLLRRIVG